MTYTAGSTFSGIGGMDYAFAAAKFDIRFQVELDPFCRSVLAAHSKLWPNAAIHEDIHDVGKRNLERVDVLFGGFPCQDVSISGQRAGIQPGTRSGLWFELARVVGELRPRILLLENVKDIISLGGTTVVGSLAEMGYDALWIPLQAAAFGAPHRRERWFCLAVPNTDRQRLCQSDSDTAIHHRDRHGTARESCGRKQFHAAEFRRQAVGNAHSLRHASERTQGQQESSVGLGPRPSQGTNRRGDTNGNQSRLGMFAHGVSEQLVGHQFPAAFSETPYAFEPPRVLPQTTPNWESKVRALGNAVVPQVVYPLAVAVRTWLERIDTP